MQLFCSFSFCSASRIRWSAALRNPAPLRIEQTTVVLLVAGYSTVAVVVSRLSLLQEISPCGDAQALHQLRRSLAELPLCLPVPIAPPPAIGLPPRRLKAQWDKGMACQSAYLPLHPLPTYIPERLAYAEQRFQLLGNEIENSDSELAFSPRPNFFVAGDGGGRQCGVLAFSAAL